MSVCLACQVCATAQVFKMNKQDKDQTSSAADVGSVSPQRPLSVARRTSKLKAQSLHNHHQTYPRLERQKVGQPSVSQIHGATLSLTQDLTSSRAAKQPEPTSASQNCETGCVHAAKRRTVGHVRRMRLCSGISSTRNAPRRCPYSSHEMVVLCWHEHQPL